MLILDSSDTRAGWSNVLDPGIQIRAFGEFVESRFDRNRPDSFFECESAFRQLVDDAFVTSCVDRTLQLALDSPEQRISGSFNQLVLRRGPGYALSIARLVQPTRYLHTAPFLAMYAPLLGQTLLSDRYRMPASYQNAVFDPAATLERVGESRIETGEILRLHPDGELHDLRIERPQLILKFTSSAWHVLEWLFDRTTLQAVQANDAALSTTQLRVASYLLGKLGHPSSVQPLKQLAEHSIPNLRWAAIQNLGRLDPTEAVKRLEATLNDPHPHLRRAAAKTLAQLRKPAER